MVGTRLVGILRHFDARRCEQRRTIDQVTWTRAMMRLRRQASKADTRRIWRRAAGTQPRSSGDESIRVSPSATRPASTRLADALELVAAARRP